MPDIENDRYLSLFDIITDTISIYRKNRY